MHIPINPTALQDLFLQLVKIPSVSFEERRVADVISSMLTAEGITVIEDITGPKIGSSAGNLICLPPRYDPHRPAMMLTGHLDTVQSTEGIKPIVHTDRITSDGTTILGGDCRVGLSTLIYLLREVARQKLSHENFIVVFTVGEEIGLLGAREIDLTNFPVSGAYVFDSSRRPGIYIKECVGLYMFNADFIGKASHSGVSPEEGINAITIASRAIAAIQLGRIDTDMSVNIGKISGGQAVNMVPDLVHIEGEVRSFFPERIKNQLTQIESTFRKFIGNGDLRFTYAADFEPYVLTEHSLVVQNLERALRQVHLTPQPIRYSGGSDANMYNVKGIPAVDVGTGAQKPHMYEEFVLIEDLVKSAEIAFALVNVQ